jgi:hypothetical protein
MIIVMVMSTHPVTLSSLLWLHYHHISAENGHHEGSLCMAFLRVVRKVKVEGKWQFLPVAKQGNKLDWTHLSHRGVHHRHLLSRLSRRRKARPEGDR